MKIKKILTAVSCAALIAATALPLTACGGAKPFEKTDLNISSYAKAYESDSQSHSLPAVEASKVVVDADSVSEVPGSAYFIEAQKQSANDVTLKTVVNKKTGKVVVKDVESYEINFDGDNRFIVVGGGNTTDDPPASLYGEDGTKLASGAFGSGFVIHKEEHYIGDDDEKSKFIRVDYFVYSSGKSETKHDYFKYEEDEAGNRTYASSKTDISEFRDYDTEFEKGNAVFAAETRIADFYAETETGALTGYSFKIVGNEMIFFKAGEETGRANIDGIGNFVFVDDVMLYTKVTDLPEGDKDANVIIPSGEGYRYLSYELHGYSVADNKDKKLDDHGVYIKEMSPIYNYSSKTYDAVAISGAKLSGKTYQRDASFQYIVTSDLKIGFDATGLGSFTSKYEKTQIVDLGGGNYAVQNTRLKAMPVTTMLTPVNDKLEPISKSNDSTSVYYENEKLISIYDGHIGYGCADLNGKVVIEPIYSNEEGFLTFYGGSALTYNNVTGEHVILSSDGKETPLPDGGADSIYDEINIMEDWYYVGITDPSKDTDPCTFTLYNSRGETLISYAGDTQVECDFIGSVMKVTKPDGKIDLIAIS